jgi:hypothetical protein
LAFQHLPQQWVTKGGTITLTVLTGTLNGSNTAVEMEATGGKLSFKANDNASIYLTSTNNQTWFSINGESTSLGLIRDGVDCVVEWGITEPITLLPIMFIMGMTGLVALFLGPIYGIILIKQKKYQTGLVLALIVTVTGFALTVAWLWS